MADVSEQRSLHPAPGRARFVPVLLAIAVFAALSTYCAIRSEGFITADACMHYLSARYAFSSPQNFVDVWNRPLAVALYSVPAWFGGRAAVRAVCMLVAIGCGLVSYRIARRQGLKWPVLALIFTLGQPMLFFHSFGEMTELPFALLLGLAFLAYQRKWFFFTACLAAWLPLGRPEGFGIVALLTVALLLHRRPLGILVLPIPLLLWDLAGWYMVDSSKPWWRWLMDSWPYASRSMYGHGQLLTLVAMLPTVISPLVMPAMIIGIWLSVRFGRGTGGPPVYSSEGFASWTDVHPHENPVRGADPTETASAPTGSGADAELTGRAAPTTQPQRREDAKMRRDSRISLRLRVFAPLRAKNLYAVFLARRKSLQSENALTDSDADDLHLRLCRVLIAALPLFVLSAHSLLYWLGDMGSYGEARYLLVVAPFWGVLSARGWEWVFDRLRWNHPIRWAGAAVLIVPIIANAIHPVVPVRPSPDWQIAREVAKWYRSDPAIRSRYPKIMAAHPAIFYYLDINPYGSPQVRSWDLQTLHDHGPGTVLIWDPVFGPFNSSANRAFKVDQIAKHGWIEIPVPAAHGIAVKNVDPKAGDVGGAWHIFVSP